MYTPPPPRKMTLLHPRLQPVPARPPTTQPGETLTSTTTLSQSPRPTGTPITTTTDQPKSALARHPKKTPPLQRKGKQTKVASINVEGRFQILA